MSKELSALPPLGLVGDFGGSAPGLLFFHFELFFEAAASSGSSSLRPLGSGVSGLSSSGATAEGTLEPLLGAAGGGALRLAGRPEH